MPCTFVVTYALPRRGRQTRPTFAALVPYFFSTFSLFLNHLFRPNSNLESLHNEGAHPNRQANKPVWPFSKSSSGMYLPFFVALNGGYCVTFLPNMSCFFLVFCARFYTLFIVSELAISVCKGTKHKQHGNYNPNE